MSREPSIEEWFGVLVCHRKEAKEAIESVTDETKEEHREHYIMIIADADEQLRGLCNRMSKVAYFASKHNAPLPQKESL